MSKSKTAKSCASHDKGVSRRNFLKFAMVGGALVAMPRAKAQSAAAPLEPVAGDLLVYARGDNVGEPILLSEIPDSYRDAAAIWAYPQDPDSGLIKEEKDSTIVLAPVNSETINDNLVGYTVDGIIAYSAVCTHFYCLVDRINAEGNIACGCHGSIFDPNIGAEPVGGPAEWPLPVMPITLIGEDQLAVADGFQGTVGGEATF